MPTDKPKLQGYVEQDLFDRFSQWKSERGIEKDSAALNQLLKEFFGVPSPQVPADEAQIRQLIELLIEEKLEQRLSNLSSNLPSDTELISEIADTLHSVEERLAALESRLLKAANEPESPGDRASPGAGMDNSQKLCTQAFVEPSSIQAQGRLPSESPLSLPGAELARRLGTNPGTLIKNRSKSTFEEWTASKDPDRKAWRYMADSKRYEPVTPLYSNGEKMVAKAEKLTVIRVQQPQ